MPASLIAMATAWALFVTRCPEPLCNRPDLNSCMTRSTFRRFPFFVRGLRRLVLAIKQLCPVALRWALWPPADRLSVVLRVAM